MRVQDGTSHPSLQRQRWSRTISESQDGTWRIQQAGGEIGASLLRWCFRDRKQGRRCWRH